MATYIPVNETFLIEYGPSSEDGPQGWENGSLPEQIVNKRPDYYYNSWYQIDNTSQYPQLTVYPNNLASLSFQVNSKMFDIGFPAVEALLNERMYRTQIYCIYPMSGQYDVLPRMLFYTLIIASLLFRRHNWLATAALGSAMTCKYSIPPCSYPSATVL